MIPDINNIVLMEFHEENRRLLEPTDQNDSIPNQEETPQDREERVATISNETETFEEREQRIQERNLPEFIRIRFRNADLISPISLEPFSVPVSLSCSSPHQRKHTFNMQELIQINPKNCPLCTRDFSWNFSLGSICTLLIDEEVKGRIREIWKRHQEAIGFSYDDYIAYRLEQYSQNQTNEPNTSFINIYQHVAEAHQAAIALSEDEANHNPFWTVREIFQRISSRFSFLHYADLNVAGALSIAIEHNLISTVKEILGKAAANGDLPIVLEILNRFGEAHFQELNVAGALDRAADHGHLLIAQEILTRFSSNHFRELNIPRAVYIAERYHHVDVAQLLRTTIAARPFFERLLLRLSIHA